MSFWIPALMVVVLAAAGLALAPRRARNDSGQAKDLSIYKDQLAEIDRDIARGVLSTEDGDFARTEISRRLLDASRRSRSVGTSSQGYDLFIIVVIAALLGPGSYALYQWLGAPGYADVPLERRLALAEEQRRTRASQATAEAGLPVETPDPHATQRYLELVAELREAVAERPDDLQGHMLLARHEGALGLFKAAYAAQEKVLLLKGDAAVADDWVAYADLLVLAAGGYVSPEAERALDIALDLEPNHPTARYFYGLSFAQTGRPDVAFRLWDTLWRDSTPDDPWVPAIRAQMPLLAIEAGINYELPPLTQMPGPDADAITAASEMSVEERAEMIQSMVDGLSERLATEGGTAEEWARLITALGVLGQQDRAQLIYDEAKDVFADQANDLSLLKSAATDAGLAP